jgi:hypothetical protein
MTYVVNQRKQFLTKLSQPPSFNGGAWLSVSGKAGEALAG